MCVRFSALNPPMPARLPGIQNVSQKTGKRRGSSLGKAPSKDGAADWNGGLGAPQGRPGHKPGRGPPSFDRHAFLSGAMPCFFQDSGTVASRLMAEGSPSLFLPLHKACTQIRNHCPNALCHKLKTSRHSPCKSPRLSGRGLSFHFSSFTSLHFTACLKAPSVSALNNRSSASEP